MIWGTLAVLTFLFMGGSSLEFYLTNLKSDVKEHVQDKACRKTILDAGKALSKDLRVLGKEVLDHVEDLVEVHSEYDSAAGDFDEVTAALKVDQKKMSRLVLDARDVMHEQMTKEEWNAVFAEKE